jgi:hypothetical protein
MYMEAVLGISLCSYLCLKLEKVLCLSYYRLCFSSTKLEKWAGQFLPRSKGGEGGGSEGGLRGRGEYMAQAMYTHMNK